MTLIPISPLGTGYRRLLVGRDERHVRRTGSGRLPSIPITHYLPGMTRAAETRALSAPPIEMARMNTVEPFARLKATLEAISRGHPAAEIGSLLTWAMDRMDLSGVPQATVVDVRGHASWTR